MKTQSLSLRVSSIGGNPEAILRSVRSSPACIGRVAEAEMAAKMAKIGLPGLWNDEPEIMVQDSTNVLVTDRHADDYPV